MRPPFNPRAKMATSKSNQPQPVDSYVDDRAYEAAQRGTWDDPRVQPAPSPFGVSEAIDRLLRFPITADMLLQLPSSTSWLPLRYSVSRATPGQSRRHAVRSSLDHLSRGPAHREWKL